MTLGHRTILALLMAARFCFGFATAFLLYIAASYFQSTQLLRDEGLFFFIISLSVLCVLLVLHRIIARYTRVRVFLALHTIALLACGMVIVRTSPMVEVLAVVMFMIVTTLLLVVYDMIVESYTNDRDDGRVHGALLTLWNAGFIIGPFVAGVVMARGGIEEIFAILLGVYAIALMIMAPVLPTLHRLNHVTRNGVISLMRRAFSFRWFQHVYGVAVILHTFYVVMVVYVPVHLLSQGFSVSQLGVVFTIALIPFLVIEYPAGLLADTRFGEREMMLLGMVFLFGSVVAMGMTAVGLPLWAWASLLFISRIGAAFVESMSEVFFYKHVDADDVGLIDVYRTAAPVAYVSVTAVVGVLFVIGGMTHIAIPLSLLVVVFVIGIYLAATMHDTPVTDRSS